jgi:hypothetical protein
MVLVVINYECWEKGYELRVAGLGFRGEFILKDFDKKK